MDLSNREWDETKEGSITLSFNRASREDVLHVSRKADVSVFLASQKPSFLGSIMEMLSLTKGLSKRVNEASLKLGSLRGVVGKEDLDCFRVDMITCELTPHGTTRFYPAKTRA